MYIYKHLTQANHHTELNEFYTALSADIDEDAFTRKVSYGYGATIVPAVSDSKVTEIAQFVMDWIARMEDINFPSNILQMKPNGEIAKVKLPCYVNGSNSTGKRNEADAVDTGIIFIDLDDGYNPKAIFNNILDDYKYVAWTTTGHQWNNGTTQNGDKIRIALFLDKDIPTSQLSSYKSAFAAWVDNSAAIDDTLTTECKAEYKIDDSCMNPSQAAIPPLYNQHVGIIELWSNIGTGTKCFDLTTLTIDASTKAVKAPTAPAKSIDVSGLVINSVLVDKADAEDKEALSALSDDGLVFHMTYAKETFKVSYAFDAS